MRVAVVVPFRSGCPWRERAWRYVRGRLEQHSDWQIIEASASQGPWCKAAAVNPVVEQVDAEIVIQADADCFTDGLQEAIEAVEAGAPWAIPHEMVSRLTEEATERVLAGADWRDRPLVQRPYRGIAGGGFVVASREVLQAVPLDRRFIGWGQDDEAHALALQTLVGEPWRGTAPLVHLWHPPQERMTRNRGSQESWALRRRYARAKNDPAAMAALIEESRVGNEPGQHPLHGDPASVGR